MAETAIAQALPVEHSQSTPTRQTVSVTASSPSASLSSRPEALATTKRKFHSLLDSITGSSAPKPTIVPLSGSNFDGSNNFDSPAKRIRLEARKRLESSSSSTTATSATQIYIQSQLLSSRLAAARRQVSGGSARSNEGDKKLEEPNYLPWSTDAFLRRLKTFADLSIWTSKPDVINEVIWAKRGWVCVGVNTISCKGGCENRIVVALRPARKDEDGKEIEGSEDYSVDVDEQLVKKYAAMVVEGHEEDCLWRDGGCRDDIYRLQIARPTTWQPQLRERYFSFAIMASSLPALTTLEIPFDVSAVAKIIPKDFFEQETSSKTSPAEATTPVTTLSTGEDTSINPAALAFALLGWHGSSSTDLSAATNSAIATCPTCFRRLGLWLYTTTSPSDYIASDCPSQPAPLNLTLNHRTYCPWTNSVSQSMPGSFSGLCVYEILLKLISNTFPGSYSRPSRATNTSVEETATGTSLAVPVEDASRTRPQSRSDRESLLAPTIRTVSSASLVGSLASTNAEYGGDDENRLADHGINREVSNRSTAASEMSDASKKRKKEKGEVEKEDKARFARLKELGRAIGLGTIKRKKRE